jgi:hypothetical protein
MLWRSWVLSVPFAATALWLTTAVASAQVAAPKAPAASDAPAVASRTVQTARTAAEPARSAEPARAAAAQASKASSTARAAVQTAQRSLASPPQAPAAPITPPSVVPVPPIADPAPAPSLPAVAEPSLPELPALADAVEVADALVEDVIGAAPGELEPVVQVATPLVETVEAQVQNVIASSPRAPSIEPPSPIESPIALLSEASLVEPTLAEAELTTEPASVIVPLSAVIALHDATPTSTVSVASTATAVSVASTAAKSELASLADSLATESAGQADLLAAAPLEATPSSATFGPVAAFVSWAASTPALTLPVRDEQTLGFEIPHQVVADLMSAPQPPLAPGSPGAERGMAATPASVVGFGGTSPSSGAPPPFAVVVLDAPWRAVHPQVLAPPGVLVLPNLAPPG